MGQRLTSLWLVLRKRTWAPPVLPKPDVNTDLLMGPDVGNPNRQRKGKSGETARRGGKRR